MGINERVTWDIRDGIGILTLNNPPENYLYEPDFISEELRSSWQTNTGLKGMVIHGAGKHFSAGGDTKRMFELMATDVDFEGRMAKGNFVLKQLQELNIPLVAAIHGVCFGGGLELALTCHIRVAGEHSLFAFPETGIHLMPGLGGIYRLMNHVGKAQSTRVILSGEIIDAEEALMINLIDVIRPRHEVFEYAFNLAKRMTKEVPLPVIQSVIKAIRHAETLPENEAIREESRLFCALALTEAKRREEHGQGISHA